MRYRAPSALETFGRYTIGLSLLLFHMFLNVDVRLFPPFFGFGPGRLGSDLTIFIL